jgi:hypothetical protein
MTPDVTLCVHKQQIIVDITLRIITVCLSVFLSHAHTHTRTHTRTHIHILTLTKREKERERVCWKSQAMITRHARFIDKGLRKILSC